MDIVEMTYWQTFSVSILYIHVQKEYPVWCSKKNLIEAEVSPKRSR